MDRKKFLEVLKSTEEMMSLLNNDSSEELENKQKEEAPMPLIYQLRENRIKSEINRQTRRLK
jgi:hypothetical protein